MSFNSSLTVDSTMIMLIAIAAAGLFTAAAVIRVHTNKKRLAKRKDMFDRHEDYIRKETKAAGDTISPLVYDAILIAAPIGLFVAGYLGLNSIVFGIVFGVAGLFVPRIILYVLRLNHEKEFEKDFLRSLEQLSASLRAGASIIQSVEDAARCKFLSKSLKRKYLRLLNNLQMGISVPDAFHDFAVDTGSKDAMDFALSLEIQDAVGGREAEAAKQAADNIKDRIELRKEIKSEFTGESSMVWIMDFILPVVVVILCIMSPTYVEAYFDNALMTLLFFAFFACSLTGSIINHRAIKRLQEG